MNHSWLWLYFVTPRTPVVGTPVQRSTKANRNHQPEANVASARGSHVIIYHLNPCEEYKKIFSLVEMTY